MLRKSCVIVVALLTLALFGSTGAYATQTFKLGFGDPPDSDQGAYAERFKAVVEGLSDGEIQIELFPVAPWALKPKCFKAREREPLTLPWFSAEMPYPS